MRLDCPNGHAAVVRNDPRSNGYLAMCDTCGWSANKVVGQEESGNHGFMDAQLEEGKRRQLGRGEGQEEEEHHSRRRRDA